MDLSRVEIRRILTRDEVLIAAQGHPTENLLSLTHGRGPDSDKPRFPEDH